MDLNEAKAELSKAEHWLTELWGRCYERAVNKIRGNWIDPEVVKKRKEMATQLANEELKGFTFKVEIKCLKKP